MGVDGSFMNIMLIDGLWQEAFNSEFGITHATCKIAFAAAFSGAYATVQITTFCYSHALRLAKLFESP